MILWLGCFGCCDRLVPRDCGLPHAHRGDAENEHGQKQCEASAIC